MKTDALAKASAAAAAMDDFAESGRKLVKLGELPAVDLTVDIGESVGENLEGDEEDEDNSGVTTDVVMKAADDDDDDEIDPLDAFMTDVVQEVKKVNAEDRAKMKPNASSRMPIDGAQDDGADDDEDDDKPTADDLNTTDMRPEDILAYVSPAH